MLEEPVRPWLEDEDVRASATAVAISLVMQGEVFRAIGAMLVTITDAEVDAAIAQAETPAHRDSALAIKRWMAEARALLIAQEARNDAVKGN